MLDFLKRKSNDKKVHITGLRFNPNNGPPQEKLTTSYRCPGDLASFLGPYIYHIPKAVLNGKAKDTNDLRFFRWIPDPSRVTEDGSGFEEDYLVWYWLERPNNYSSVNWDSITLFKIGKPDQDESLCFTYAEIPDGMVTEKTCKDIVSLLGWIMETSKGFPHSMWSNDLGVLLWNGRGWRKGLVQEGESAAITKSLNELGFKAQTTRLMWGESPF